MSSDCTLPSAREIADAEASSSGKCGECGVNGSDGVLPESGESAREIGGEEEDEDHDDIDGGVSALSSDLEALSEHGEASVVHQAGQQDSAFTEGIGNPGEVDGTGRDREVARCHDQGPLGRRSRGLHPPR
jgi:hypothetical protein